MDGQSGTRHPTQQELRACLEVGKLLTSTLDLQEVLDRILARMRDLIDAENWSLLLKDRATAELTFAAVAGLEREAVTGIRLAPGEGIAGHVAETGEPLFIPDAPQDPRFCPKVDSETGFRTRSVLCVPMQIHGRVLGVIELVNAKECAPPAEKNYVLLTILADYAAIAVENSFLMDEVQRLSLTDDYTGLRNARFLHQTLDRMLPECAAAGRPLALVFLDLDRFKAVVDAHGHLLGSRALAEVGRTIQGALGPGGILTKYGGDEYVILLPDHDRQAALAAARRVLQAVRDAVFLCDQARPVRLTASFGVALFPEDASDKKQLLIRADQAMFAVKRSGKDGVGLAGPDRPGPAAAEG